PYVGRHPRCAERLRRTDHGSAHFQRAQTRALPAPFLRVRRRLWGDRRLRNAGLWLCAAADRQADRKVADLIGLGDGHFAWRDLGEESSERLASLATKW